MIEWGPSIPVNGVMPLWLKQSDICDLFTGEFWCYPSGAPSTNPPEEWAWSHRDGRPNILAVRLPSDHPYYRTEDRCAAMLEEFGEAHKEYHEYMCSASAERYEAARAVLMAELLK
jgi:hypothetical protein